MTTLGRCCMRLAKPAASLVLLLTLAILLLGGLALTGVCSYRIAVPNLKNKHTRVLIGIPVVFLTALSSSWLLRWASTRYLRRVAGYAALIWAQELAGLMSGLLIGLRGCYDLNAAAPLDLRRWFNGAFVLLHIAVAVSSVDSSTLVACIVVQVFWPLNRRGCRGSAEHFTEVSRRCPIHFWACIQYCKALFVLGLLFKAAAKLHGMRALFGVHESVRRQRLRNLGLYLNLA